MNVGMKLILAFVTLIVGVSMVGVIATQSLAVTDRTVVAEEVVDYTPKMTGPGEVNVSAPNQTLANAPTSWKVLDCPLVVTNVTNASGSDLTITTDYIIVLSTGIVEMQNTTDTNMSNNIGNQTLVTYNYCGDDYLNLGWGRTLLNLIAGFFAIALLMVAIGLFYSVGKDVGIV